MVSFIIPAHNEEQLRSELRMNRVFSARAN
jgi:hypothetical protein